MPHPIRLRGLLGVGGRKNVRGRGDGCLEENTVFQTQQGSCTGELNVTVTV